jgi:hypothetical protein
MIYKILLFTNFLLFIFGGSDCQTLDSLKIESEDSIQQIRKIDSALATENLFKLNSRPETFYSVSYEARAKAVHKLVKDCILFYESRFPPKNFSVKLYVLNKADWEKVPFGQPYGLIGYFPGNNLEIIAAEKNAMARLVGAPDDSVKTDSVVSGYDMGALHELGHYFFITLNGMDKDLWFNEFIADYFMICYIKEKHVGFEIEEMAKITYSSPQHKTLDDFQKFYASGLGPANYDWYQRKFAQLGFALYPKLKLELIKQILQNYSAVGKNIDCTELIEKLAPDIMNSWLKGMQ